MTETIDGSCKVGAVVVTYNPDLSTLRLVIDAVSRQVAQGIVVDNASRQPEKIQHLLPTHFAFLGNPKNLGIARALNQGVTKLLVNRELEWILTLDQDVVMAPDYVIRLLGAVIRYPHQDKLGVVTGSLPEDSTGSRQLVSPRHFYNAGNLVRVTVFKQVRFREEFFIDSVDYDFSFQVRQTGYEVLSYDWPMLTHSLGASKRLLGRVVRYEPSDRYYYIVRNTTVLLCENKLPLSEYTGQVARWGFLVTLFEGPSAAARSILKGLGDALGGRLDWDCTEPNVHLARTPLEVQR